MGEGFILSLYKEAAFLVKTCRHLEGRYLLESDQVGDKAAIGN